MLPSGIVSSGFPAVEATCRKCGLRFDPWQRDLNRCILAKAADGSYAADTVVLSIPRQVGKTYDVGGLVFADSIINPDTTTVWTAHRFTVARETFNALKAVATSERLSPHIDPDEITTAAGNECIPFRNGSRILFKARERGAIRGFSKVRRLILDEAQILTEAAMSDLAPTQNQAVNPQIILMGTPPKPTDPGEVFANLRMEALEGMSEDVLYVELSAPDGCDLDDIEAWRIANPSLGTRTPVKAIRRLRRLLPSDDDFAREALGIWGASAGTAVITADEWFALEDRQSKAGPHKAWGLDVTPDQKHAAIGVGSDRPDGMRHVELVEHRSGTAWAPARMAELKAKWGGDVALDPASPAGSLLSDLIAAGVDPVLVSGREMTQACGEFYTAATDSKLLRHIGQPKLNVAVDAGRKRTVQDAWAWHRRDSTSDISPLVAVTLASHLLGVPSSKRERSGQAMFA